MADDINISPDMINNLINMLKDSNSSAENSKQNIDSNSNDNVSSKTDSSSNSSSNIDFDTIMKIKSIIETLNYKDDPDSKLLYSLKPYLRKSRQEKLDQYINIVKISHISKIFKQ